MINQIIDSNYLVDICFIIGLAVVFGLGFGINWLLMQHEMNSLVLERDSLEQLITVDQMTRHSDAKLIKRLASEAEINRSDAQRYALVRYYIENDHGELAVEAFFGPQAILRANALDAILDEELDRRYLMSNDNA
jgi:hypothetical protein